MGRKRNKPNAIQKAVRKSIRDFINQLNGVVHPEPVINAPVQGTEAWYRDKLAKKLKGEIEVQTEVGRIDILTACEIIEVKNARNWKSALGQIKSYGKYYPKHKMRIHLFRVLTESKLEIIKKVCDSEDIILTWE